MRKLIYPYFTDKRKFSISINDGDPLWPKIRDLSARKIRELIECDSFAYLAKVAHREDRSVGNLIKHRLREKLCPKTPKATKREGEGGKEHEPNHS